MRPTARLVWLFPQPVRTAVIAITGFVLLSIVERGPSRVKSAPAANAIEALCMTASWERSEYASTTSSMSSRRIRSANSSSGRIGIPRG